MTNDNTSIVSAQASSMSNELLNTTNNTSNLITSLNANRHDDNFCIHLNDEHSLAYEACKNGDISLVKQLISVSNVNLKDKHGRKSTFLHFAAGFGRKEVCEYLLNNCKADPSIKDEG